jgi:hypothetical protein
MRGKEPLASDLSPEGSAENFHVKSSSFKRNCHPDRSEEPALREVEGDLLFLFCPSKLTAPNKSHTPPTCHPERTQISYFTALPAATYAALREESRMKSTEATVLTGNLGEPRDLQCAPAPAQRSPFR